MSLSQLYPINIDNPQHYIKIIPLNSLSPYHQTSAAARFMKYATLAGRQVPIYLAQEFKHEGYKCAIDPIDANSLNNSVENVKVAVEGSRLFSESQKSNASFIIITYIAHVYHWNLKATRSSTIALCPTQVITIPTFTAPFSSRVKWGCRSIKITLSLTRTSKRLVRP